jgi:peptide-methionine (S)-S-oxide reductase
MSRPFCLQQGLKPPAPLVRRPTMTRLLVAFSALLAAGLALLAPAANAQSGVQNQPRATALFAGGCFWCMEKPFDDMPGVIATTSGFSGGTVANPSYNQVVAGGTGHIEVVQVTYDPSRVSYAQLLRTYWLQVDPFDGRGQFCDRGDTYRPAIFVASPVERAAAEASRNSLQQRFGREIAVEILPAAPFYAAESYHQDYYRTNPARYRFYRASCGRDARLRAVWGREAGG